MGIVKYYQENLPPVGQDALDQAAIINDEDINYSDMPNLAGVKLRPRQMVDRSMYKPVKIVLTCRLDADIVAWLKQDGKGYQTRLNSILRQVMTGAQKTEGKKPLHIV